MLYSALLWNSLRFACERDTPPMLHMTIHMHVCIPTHKYLQMHTSVCVWLQWHVLCGRVYICGVCTRIPSCRTADRRCQYSLTNVFSPYVLTWETNCRYKSLPLLMSQFQNALNKFQFIQKLLPWSCIAYPRNTSPRGQYQNVVSSC